ncbi:MATE family efflux transporter [Caminicella sporogenes]|uniref:MATE family efflux transporter n=1 Tax=Caminicella sporogenes TaxID=166485 RepID=UPI00254091FD|nr:MATE family efflux transporter [Caminicella sporogenes]WIF95806.1 MATE family efflux transporter [Caminicella sporogenes]
MVDLKVFLKRRKNLLASIILLALPAVGEMSLNTLLGLSDTLMISYFVGSEGLAAVGFANQIIFTLIFIFSSFNTGATAMIARAYGEENYKKLNRVAGQGLSINIFIGIIITVLALLFAKEIFSIYDMTQEVMHLTLDYFYIVIFGCIFMFLSFSYAAILRGAGNTVTPMIITGIANILNIIGNYVLITGVGPFPKMGIAGAAWATTISRMIAAVLYTFILFNPKGNVYIKLKYMKITKNILKPLWNLSYPGAVEQSLMQTSFIAVGVIVSKLDTISEAAFRILINIESISYMPAVGLSIAAATLVGKSLGERDINKAVEVGYTASVFGALWGIFIGIIFLIFPKQLLAVFTSDIKLISVSVATMYAVGINQPFLNFMIVMTGALRGAGDTRSVMIITFIRLWLFFVPLTYIFTIMLRQGLAGTWYGEIISMFIFCIVVFMRFRSKKWTNIKIDVKD